MAILLLHGKVAVGTAQHRHCIAPDGSADADVVAPYRQRAIPAVVHVPAFARQRAGSPSRDAQRRALAAMNLYRAALDLSGPCLVDFADVDLHGCGDVPNVSLLDDVHRDAAAQFVMAAPRILVGY